MKKILLFTLLLISSISACFALSEDFKGEGQINAWHDGIVSDRASGTGIIEYAAERYEGGLSTGLNIIKGIGSYSFRAADYSVRVDDFTGSIIVESDATSTIVDGNGTGVLKTRSFNASRMGVLVSGFPSGELNAKGVWEIHASSTRAAYVDPMTINVTAEAAPVEDIPPVVIDSDSEVPI
jgi:hypothetical protein